MNKCKFTYVFVCICMFLLPAKTYSIITSETEFHQICDSYLHKLDKNLLLISIDQFLKEHKSSDYVPTVRYIKALVLDDFKKSTLELNTIVKKYPDSAVAPLSYYLLGKYYYDNQRYMLARKHFEDLIKKYNDHFLVRESYLNIAKCYTFAHDLGNAEETLKKILLEIAPFYISNDDLNYIFGVILYERNLIADAVLKFEKVNSPRSYYYRALCYIKLNKYLPAMTALRKLIKEYPKHELSQPAQLLLAECFYRTENYSLAYSKYNSLLTEPYYKNNLDFLLFRIATCLFYQLQYERSINMFRKISSKYPHSSLVPYCWYMIAEAYVRKGKITEALENYSYLIKKYPSSNIIPYVYYYVGWHYIQQEDYSAAINSLNSFIKYFPDHKLYPQCLLMLGEAYYRDKQYHLALTQFQRILKVVSGKDELSDIAFYCILKVFFAQKRYEHIVSHYHYVLKQKPLVHNKWRAYSYLIIGESYLKLNYYPQATKTYNFIIREFPQKEITYLALHGKAYCHFLAHEYSLAEAEREKLAQYLSESQASIQASNELELGKIYYNQKKFEEAARAFEDFIANHPGHSSAPEALYWGGKAYYKLKYYGTAIKLWIALVEQYLTHPLRPDALMKIADTYFRAQHYTDAIKYYQMILNEYPDLSETVKMAHLHIAQSFYNAGQYIDAITKYGEVLNNYPDDSIAQDALDGITMVTYKLTAQQIKEDIDLVPLKKYLKEHPASRLAASVVYRIAERLFYKRRWSDSLVYFEKLLSEYETEKYTENTYYYIAEAY